MFDGNGLIEYASPSFSAALGLRQDEVIGRLWRALTHPLDVPNLRAALGEAGAGRAAHRHHRGPPAQERRHAGSGSKARRRCASAAASAIAVEITGRDVTRTRAAEDEGRRLSSQLEALVAGAPYGILMLDEFERIAVINEQACSLLELTQRPEELVGTAIAALLPSFHRLLAEPEAGHRPAAGDRQGRRDRALRPLRLRGRPPDRLRPRPARRGPAVGLPRHHAVQAPGRGAGRVPGHDEPRDQDAAVGHRGRGGAADQRRAAGARARAGRGDRRRRAGARRARARHARRHPRRGRAHRGRVRGLRPAAAADLDRRRAAPEPARPPARAAASTSTRRCRTRCTATPRACARSCSTWPATRSSTRSPATRGSRPAPRTSGSDHRLRHRPRDRRRGPADACSSRGRATTPRPGPAPASGSASPAGWRARWTAT